MSNQNTYLFYDIETTGLNKCFDQVLQFAAIRTDMALKELSRHEINICLNNDVVPSPYAVLTHRIGPSQFKSGEKEVDAIQKIHALLNTPGTISVGYNSLGFDDEFLRYSFYRNLRPPYTHQYSNRCGRMDIYPIALLYYLFKKELLIWPENNLKLDNINQLNGFTTGQAHNAMVDVTATLEFARKLYTDTSMWPFVIGYFQKSADEERIQKAESFVYLGNNRYPTGMMINGKFGAKTNYAVPVMLLGQHHHYKNQQVFLRLDESKLSTVTHDTINDTTWSIKKRLGEPPLFLPLKARYLTLLSEERQKIFNENIAFIKENAALFEAIQRYHLNEKYPDHPNRDIDAALYSIDFPSSQEEKLFQAFHAALPEEKLGISRKFPNPIRRAQAERIVRRHYPEIAIDKEIFSETPVDFKGEKKYTLEQAMLDIAEIEKNKPLDDEQKSLLAELKVFYGASQ